MDAEILFFMTEKDQTVFLNFAESFTDSIKNETSIYRLILGDCELLFTPSQTKDNVMVTGSLKIRLGNSENACKDQERAKSAFRKLRNNLKKNYWSRLAYLNKNKKDKLTPSRNHWLGPDAKKWKEADSENHTLKLSETSWMEFEIGF